MSEQPKMEDLCPFHDLGRENAECLCEQICTTCKGSGKSFGPKLPGVSFVLDLGPCRACKGTGKEESDGGG